LSYSLIGFGVVGLLLLATLVWLSISTTRSKADNGAEFDLSAQLDGNHIVYLPQIKQALAKADLKYLGASGQPGLASKVGKERRKIALAYLVALREDFQKLHEVARVIAVMSPEVEVVRELQGLRLNAVFVCRYYLIYLRLFLGIAPFEALNGLGDMFSGLTVRMEAAIHELGESTVLSELSASLNGRRLGAH
jgi:hypothetical protein